MSTEGPVNEVNSLNGYAITISVNGIMGKLSPSELRIYELYPKQSHLRQRLDEIWETVMAKTKAKTSQFIYELSDKSKLHIHGMFTSDKKFTYKSLQQSGYQVYIRRLETELEERDWYIYTNKDNYMFDGDLEDQQADTLPKVATGCYCVDELGYNECQSEKR